MSVMSMEWHERGIQNSVLWLRERELELQRLEATVARQRAEVDFRREQIAEAKKRGKLAFDAERFMVPRKKAAAE